MSLVFERPAQDQPGTHALVIGVGGYRHLLGGSDPKNQVIPKIGLLRQLSCAPRSAVALADLLIRRKDDWVRPLQSVELLLSTGPEDAALEFPDTIDAARVGRDATFVSVQDAYDRWRDRCNSHGDNVAVFYHCGHGIEKEEQFLLTEDFGASVNNPWRGAFAFDSTQIAMHGCKASTQLFFVDACREVTNPMLEHDLRVSPLESPDFEDTEGDSVFVMKGTAAKEVALGPKGGVAYCTQAIIRGLENDAAVKKNGRWQIRTGMLAERITEILRKIKDDQGFKQRCPCQVTNSTEILALPDRPTVELSVDCDPAEATAASELVCTSLTDPDDVREANGAPIQETVPAGIYQVSAHFPAGEFPDRESEPVVAWPPSVREVFECRE